MSKIHEQLFNVQSEISDPIKDQAGYNYNYAGFDSYLEILRPLLKKHDLFFAQNVKRGEIVKVEDGLFMFEIIIDTTVFNRQGEKLEFHGFPLYVEKQKKMSIEQSLGASITYGKRYALSAIFGMSSEDNDAAQRREQRQAEKAAKELISEEEAQSLLEFALKVDAKIEDVLKHYNVSSLKELNNEQATRLHGQLEIKSRTAKVVKPVVKENKEQGELLK